MCTTYVGEEPRSSEPAAIAEHASASYAYEDEEGEKEVEDATIAGELPPNISI